MLSILSCNSVKMYVALAVLDPSLLIFKRSSKLVRNDVAISWGLVSNVSLRGKQLMADDDGSRWKMRYGSSADVTRQGG